MGTHNIRVRFYREVDKKYTGCNLDYGILLDCAIIGISGVPYST